MVFFYIKPAYYRKPERIVINGSIRSFDNIITVEVDILEIDL